MTLHGPVLIANRGEIAVRIARTVHGLGLSSVALVAADDPAALHGDVADVAVPVGSYTSVEDIIAAAVRSGAAAVHPGYGFLSEDPRLARAVLGAGLVWIGPPPAAIELMGDKGRAKDAAVAAGVPVVPTGDDGSYPVVVKAVAGGGGRGMRVVRSAGELEEARAAASREAEAAFGDGRLIVERYLERPRHLEVQLLADAHGAVVHLGERECSLQRRHQKVIEECPSPAVDPELRARMGEAAVALARSCGYEGAGTVEFIAQDGAFFFLEMNTRLQVEHPVTELVYGIDLVEQQLRVAFGEPLGVEQAALVPRGHAVEARLYAEDPAGGFLPSTGTIRHYAEPTGPGVRVDSGVTCGSVVGTAYDPMLAKVVAVAEDRPTALRRLDRALAELELLGVATNAAFSRTLLAHDDVCAGELDTGLLERLLPQVDHAAPDDLAPAAVLAAAGTASPAGPWRRSFTAGDARVDAGVVTLGERSWDAAIAAPPPGHGTARVVRVTLDGLRRRYVVAADDETIWIARDGHHLELRTRRRETGAAAAPAGALTAPMPGTVLEVRVARGDAVAQGAVLLVLESMKMELAITAPHAGTVTDLELAAGDRVVLGQVLVAVAAPASAEEAAR